MVKLKLLLKITHVKSINCIVYLFLGAIFIFIKLSFSFLNFLYIIRHHLPILDAHCFCQYASKSTTSFLSHTLRKHQSCNVDDPKHPRQYWRLYLQVRTHLHIEIILKVRKYQLLFQHRLPILKLHL